MRWVVALALALAAAVPGGGSARSAEPGVTPTQILLGTTAPLTGADTASAAIARGADAYFRYVNAHGGVRGRSIALTVADDAADPAVAVEETRRLVERDRVFAVVAPAGTGSVLATRGYLTSAKVPQLFAASGASTLGRDGARFPWTLGFRPSGRAEGWILGRYLARARPRARVAVLQEGDDGRDLLAGLRLGIARSGVRVVATGSSASEVARLQSAGADVLAAFAPAAVAAEALAEAGSLGWRPLVLSSADAAAAAPVGAISLGFVKDPGDPRWTTDPGLRLYRTIMARYARAADVRDPGFVVGMATAYATVETLKRAGPTPTRAVLMARARTMGSVSNPFLLPGIAVRTGPGDGFPVEQGGLRRRTAAGWRSFGGLWSSGVR